MRHSPIQYSPQQIKPNEQSAEPIQAESPQKPVQDIELPPDPVKRSPQQVPLEKGVSDEIVLTPEPVHQTQKVLEMEVAEDKMQFMVSPSESVDLNQRMTSLLEETRGLMSESEQRYNSSPGSKVPMFEPPPVVEHQMEYRTQNMSPSSKEFPQMPQDYAS